MNDATEFNVPCDQRQLFLDDVGIEHLENLTRTLHQPSKKGAVVRSANPTQTIQTRTAPAWDPEEEVYKLWVIGTDESYRVSADGLHWTPGSEPNIGGPMAVRDANDPDPDRRYKAALLNAGFAVSPDGVNWTKLDVPPVPSSDEGNFSYSEQEGLFIHTVKRSGPYGRSLAMATSTDFEHWDDYGLVFHADAMDQEMGRDVIEARLANPSLRQTEYNTPEHYSVQIYNMGVFRYEGIYIGLPSMYHHTGKVPTDWPGFDRLRLSPYILDCVRQYGDYTGFYNIQMVCSRDLKNWTRLGERKPFMETSTLGGGAYDLQGLLGPSNAVVRGDELWFYYTGTKQYAFITSGDVPGYDDYHPDTGAVCLAVLRRDGFISLDAGEEVGVICTEPFTLNGDTLFVNVDVPNGELGVEVLSTDGNTLAASARLHGDYPAARIAWTEGNIAQFLGQTIHLRFTLRNGRFYSYWFDSIST